jgi:hypothetical protein
LFLILAKISQTFYYFVYYTWVLELIVVCLIIYREKDRSVNELYYEVMNKDKKCS